MKKLLITFLLGTSLNYLNATDITPPPRLYHYGFILSCGQTVYLSFDHELTDKELLEWTDFYENTKCNTIQDGDNENPVKP